MITFRPGNLLWCVDHLDVGVVLRADTMDDGEIFLEVAFSSGLTCITGDEESHADYRRARRRNGIWEFEEDDTWRPINFSESFLCPEPPTFQDDPEEGVPPDMGPEGGFNSPEDG